MRKNQNECPLKIEVQISGWERIEILFNEILSLKQDLKQYLLVDKSYTIKEAAKILKTSVSTLNKKIEQGKIKCLQDRPRGSRTVPAIEIENYLKSINKL